MKFTGHLDLILTWERTFRRADLPLAYSEGFSPRPVLNLAAPLPLGFTSTGEIGDFWLSETISRDHIIKELSRALPPGILLSEIFEIEDIHGPKLPSLVQAASYQAELSAPPSDLPRKIVGLLDLKELLRIRKEKEYDLRPLIKDLSLNESVSSDLQVQMTLSMLPGATGRPDEVLAALEISPTQARICRTEIIIKELF
jgi:radical SAM-linked protein